MLDKHKTMKRSASIIMGILIDEINNLHAEVEALKGASNEKALVSSETSSSKGTGRKGSGVRQRSGDETTSKQS